MVYAWELRYDPATDPNKKYACYRPGDAQWQTWPLAYPNLRVVVGACGTKYGKLEPLTNPIPTPSGWKTMGDIQSGDYVFDRLGKPTKVLWTTDVMHSLDCYEVEFQDGEKIVVGKDHLWLTETHVERKNQARVASKNDRVKSTNSKAQVRDTEEIKKTLEVSVGGKIRPNHSITVCDPVQFPSQDLAVDPYVMGAWLGDGTRCSGGMTGIDPEVFAGIRAAGYEVRQSTSNEQSWYVQKLITDLKAVGVSDDKHVPAQYLIGSVEQRLSLLQGLMDTDGTISKRGDSCFDNTNKALADAVAEICWSLGIKVNRQERFGRLNGVDYKLCYRVHFTTDLPVFRIQRKLDRIRPISLKAKRRYIVAVRSVESVPAKCIRVENAEHLYLTSHSFIVTHNTMGCCIRMVKEAWDNQGSRNWWVAPSQDQSENAMEEIAKMLPPGRFEVLIGKHKILVLTSSGDLWSTIEFKTGSDPSKLRGFGVNFYVMDEAAQGMPYGSFVSVETTTTNTRGRGIVISTPNGRGWFYDVYEWGEKYYADGTPRFSEEEPDPHPDFMSIRMPSHANPFNDLKVIEEKRNTLSKDTFRQEYLAQFMLESAGVFTNFSKFFDKELTFLEKPVDGHMYVAGIDLADKDDYSVLVIMDRLERKVVDFHRFHKIGWAAQKIKITGIVKHWNAIAVIDDSGIGDPINEDLRAMGVPLFPYKISTNAAKCHLIETLQLALENSSLKSPYIGVMKSELEFYESKTTPSGNKTYSAPRGKHDDTIIALALATLLCMQKPGIYRHRQIRGV